MKDQRKRIFPINQLIDEAGLQEVKEFITAHNFFVLELDEKTRNNEIFRKMADKAGFYSRTYQTNCFKHVAIVINGKGTKTFNDVFHRSSSDVDKRMLPHKEMKKVFEPKVYDFLQIIKKEFGDVQIRGMKEARTRVEQLTTK